jgi:acetyltransferase
MTVRHLDAFFKPKSIALIGASDRRGSIGATLARNLIKGDFQGTVTPVNPKHKQIAGRRAYADVASLPETPDLGVICTPPTAVPGIIDALGEKGTRAAVVITAGFGERRAAGGVELQRAVQAAAKRHRLRLMGPNCLGILVPGIGLNASFAHRAPRPGALAFVAQSGAIVTSIIDWTEPRGIGFSHMVSLGDMADVAFGDMLDYLASDASTRGILLYIEAISDARHFMSAARAASRMKPVIVVKAGRHPEGARAVESHTGVLAGTDAVYDAAFRRAGVLRVHGLMELFDAVEILAIARALKGDRLAIMSNGGGVAVLATDELMDQGGRLASLSTETIAALDQVLPATWSHANPIDLIGDASGSRYADALQVLSKEPGADAILVLHCPTAVTSATDAAQAVIANAPDARGPLLLTSWVGEQAVRGAREAFAERRIPSFDTPEHAVRGFMYLVRHRRNQQLLIETPPSVPEDYHPDLKRVRALIAGIDADGWAARRGWLSEVESKQLLSAYGISVVPTRLAETPEAAAALAAEIGGPVVLKLQSPDLLHKSAIGGVVLDLIGPQAVLEQARSLYERIAAAQPEARLTGFSVQPMVRRPGAYELIVGVADDPQFGPVILAGQGGTRVEAIDDKALGLPPMNMRLARELLSRTRVHRLLQGAPGHPAVNLDAVALVLVRVSQLICDLPEIRELDINPLLADPFGVVALDARIRVEPPLPGAVEKTRERALARLAIRPYPKELEQTVTLGDGRSLLLRPILPEDEPALQEAFSKLTPEEVRLRFFAPMRTLDHVAAARFTQIDYDRDMALILTDPGIAGRTQIYGVVSLSADADNRVAEYAVLVRHDMAGMGLGILLMRCIIDYARQRGIREIVGDVLRENHGMLKLCQVLGFSVHRDPDDFDIVKVRLQIDPAKEE